MADGTSEEVTNALLMISPITTIHLRAAQVLGVETSFGWLLTPNRLSGLGISFMVLNLKERLLLNQL